MMRAARVWPRTQSALHGRRCLFLDTNDIDALLDDLLVFVNATAAVGSVGTWAFELAFHLRVVNGSLLIDDLDDAIDFLVGDKAALCPAEVGCAGREKQHVALAEQFVGTHRIENGAGIDSGSDLKGDTRWYVGLEMTPVMTSTLGRWVATMQWMPAARAICVMRAMQPSTSFLAINMRSANSSMITTM